MTDSEFLQFSILMLFAFLTSPWVARAHGVFIRRAPEPGDADHAAVGSVHRSRLATVYRVVDVIVWLGGLCIWILSK